MVAGAEAGSPSVKGLPVVGIPIGEVVGEGVWRAGLRGMRNERGLKQIEYGLGFGVEQPGQSDPRRMDQGRVDPIGLRGEA